VIIENTKSTKDEINKIISIKIDKFKNINKYLLNLSETFEALTLGRINQSFLNTIKRPLDILFITSISLSKSPRR
jgi:hypothetical protein